MNSELNITEHLLNSGIEEDAVLTVAGTPFSIKVIYRNRFQMASLLGVDVQSAQAEIEYAASDRNGAKTGNSKIQIGAETFNKLIDFEFRDKTRIITRLSND